MKDFVDSVRTHVKERVFSPLSGAFALSWLAWNHLYLLILLSDDPVMKKMELASELVYGSTWEVLGRGLLFPFLSAVIFILVYPKPAQWLYSYWQKAQRDLKIQRAKIEDETPMTVAESRALRLSSMEVEKKYETCRGQLHTARVNGRSLEDTVAQLRSRIEGEEREVQPGPAPDVEVGLDELDSLVELLAKRDGSASKAEIGPLLSKSQVAAMHLIDRAFRGNLVVVEKMTVSLTEKGRAVAVAKNYAS